LIVVNESHQGAVAMQITTIGLDIAKNVFQVHGIDAAEKVVVRKQLHAALCSIGVGSRRGRYSQTRTVVEKERRRGYY
jgi:hypothetical protein